MSWMEALPRLSIVEAAGFPGQACSLQSCTPPNIDRIQTEGILRIVPVNRGLFSLAKYMLP